MEYKVEDLSAVKKKIQVTVPTPDFNKAIESALAEYVSSTRLPGFRKGKVPASLIESRYRREVYSEAMTRVVDNSISKIFDELKEKIRDFVKKAIENPNTIFAINSNTANEDLIDGTVVTPNKIISLFNSVLGKFANMPSNILFPKAWSDNSFLVAKELTKDMYEDFYGNDKEMNETVETNAIEEFNLSTTVQQREELVGLQKLIIKHLLYYIAKRDNRSAMNAFNDKHSYPHKLMR